MSATTARKPAPPGTPGRDQASKVSSSPASAARRGSTPSANGTTNGVTRTRSVRSGTNGSPVSARAAVRKPGGPSNLSMSASQADGNDEDAREEQAVFMADLKERLQKAETDAEERQKQVDVLNARLDDAIKEQAKLEERAHEEEEKVESLEAEKQKLARHQRELEGIYEAERVQAMKDKEEAQNRVEELQETIQRLKETMAKKNVEGSDGEEGRLSRASSFRQNPSRNSSSQNIDTASSFAPPSTVQRSDSRNHSKLIHQKDQIIEGLRLELAEFQIKMMEMDNAGGGRLRELEKQMVDIRMANARLIEDNESFQLLLGEKTLNGTLSRGDMLRPSSAHSDRAPSRNGPLNSLADELGGLEGDEGAEGEVVRKLEHEINGLKDQNKALTLYINKIIGRLLQHQGFESVLGGDEDENAGGAALNTNKELPPPPPPKESEEGGFLQRAKSVMGGSRNKPRPMSYTAQRSNLNEDPETAPRIPLQRASTSRTVSSENYHRHSTSEMPPPGSIVTNMFRAPPPAATPGQTSPGLVSPRNSFFGIPISTANSNPSSRVPSTGAPPKDDERDDVKSVSETSHVDTPSPPRREMTSTMTGKQMRPLRLVQNSEEEQRARKAANRASWFGGFSMFSNGEQKASEAS
ncbi:hypothetical protein DPSP01_000389 [Paraphaeosphaeria sporulosa]|uniref:M protein, serotype 2.1 n=1 Tax=Paraphaeosphaeria sporulosa TaxID=1460663 RepID=A0A177C8N6_9PLEO|nr:uncharacterized protein CC84DRAFT_855283 [Paraphaeosphaeria sporulosa]OAG03491.1 hypothetical protein CC84DRAFT_855283 [Paraphaeosphaeria sporulosa]